MSSSCPMRPAGTRAATSVPWSRASRFMSDAKAPGAIALTTMLSWIPRSAGVVDEDVELRLALRIGGGERMRALDGRHVGRQREARADLIQLGRRLVAGIGLARRDVDARAGCQEARRDHPADAARPTGD